MKVLYTIIGFAFILFIVVTSYMILFQPLLDARKKEKKEKKCASHFRLRIFLQRFSFPINVCQLGYIDVKYIFMCLI